MDKDCYIKIGDECHFTFEVKKILAGIANNDNIEICFSGCGEDERRIILEIYGDWKRRTARKRWWGLAVLALLVVLAVAVYPMVSERLSPAPAPLARMQGGTSGENGLAARNDSASQGQPATPAPPAGVPMAPQSTPAPPAGEDNSLAMNTFLGTMVTLLVLVGVGLRLLARKMRREALVKDLGGPADLERLARGYQLRKTADRLVMTPR